MPSFEELKTFFDGINIQHEKCQTKLKELIESIPDTPYQELKTQLKAIQNSTDTLSIKLATIEQHIQAYSDLHTEDRSEYETTLNGIKILFGIFEHQFSTLENALRENDPIKTQAAYLLALHHAKIPGYGEQAAEYFNAIDFQYLPSTSLWDIETLGRLLRYADESLLEKILNNKHFNSIILNIFNTKTPNYSHYNKFFDFYCKTTNGIFVFNFVIENIKTENIPKFIQIAFKYEVIKTNVILKAIELNKISLIFSDLKNIQNLSDFFNFYNNLSLIDKSKILITCQKNTALMQIERFSKFINLELLLHAIREFSNPNPKFKQDEVRQYLDMNKREELIHAVGEKITEVADRILAIDQLNLDAFPYLANLVRSIFEDPRAVAKLTPEQHDQLFSKIKIISKAVADTLDNEAYKPKAEIIELHHLTSERDAILKLLESKALSDTDKAAIEKSEKFLSDYALREFEKLEQKGIFLSIADKILKSLTIRETSTLEAQVRSDSELDQDDPIRLFTPEFILRLFSTRESLPIGFEPFKKALISSLKTQNLAEHDLENIVKKNIFSEADLRELLQAYRIESNHEAADRLAIAMIKSGRSVSWDIIQEIDFKHLDSLGKIILADSNLIRITTEKLTARQTTLEDVIEGKSGIIKFLKDTFEASLGTTLRALDKRAIALIFSALISLNKPEIFTQASLEIKELFRLALKEFWYQPDFLNRLNSDWLRALLNDNILVHEWIVSKIESPDQSENSFQDKNGHRIFKLAAQKGLFDIFLNHQNHLRKEFAIYIPNFIINIANENNPEKNFQLAEFLLKNDEIANIIHQTLQSGLERFSENDFLETLANTATDLFDSSKKINLKIIAKIFLELLQQQGPGVFKNKSPIAQNILRTAIKLNWDNFAKSCSAEWIRFLTNDDDFSKSWLVSKSDLKAQKEIGLLYKNQNGLPIFIRAAELGLTDIFYELGSPNQLKPEYKIFIPEYIAHAYSKNPKQYLSLEQLQKLYIQNSTQGAKNIANFILNNSNISETSKAFMAFNLIKNSPKHLNALKITHPKLVEKVINIIIDPAETKTILTLIENKKADYQQLSDTLKLLKSLKTLHKEPTEIIDQAQKELQKQISRQKKPALIKWFLTKLDKLSKKPTYVVPYYELKTFHKKNKPHQALINNETDTQPHTQQFAFTIDLPIHNTSIIKQATAIITPILPLPTVDSTREGNNTTESTTDEKSSILTDIKTFFVELREEFEEVFMQKQEANTMIEILPRYIVGINEIANEKLLELQEKIKELTQKLLLLNHNLQNNHTQSPSLTEMQEIINGLKHKKILEKQLIDTAKHVCIAKELGKQIGLPFLEYNSNELAKTQVALEEMKANFESAKNSTNNSDLKKLLTQSIKDIKVAQKKLATAMLQRLMLSEHKGFYFDDLLSETIQNRASANYLVNLSNKQILPLNDFFANISSSHQEGLTDEFILVFIKHIYQHGTKEEKHTLTNLQVCKPNFQFNTYTSNTLKYPEGIQLDINHNLDKNFVNLMKYNHEMRIISTVFDVTMQSNDIVLIESLYERIKAAKSILAAIPNPSFEINAEIQKHNPLIAQIESKITEMLQKIIANIPDNLSELKAEIAKSPLPKTLAEFQEKLFTYMRQLKIIDINDEKLMALGNYLTKMRDILPSPFSSYFDTLVDLLIDNPTAIESLSKEKFLDIAEHLSQKDTVLNNTKLITLFKNVTSTEKLKIIVLDNISPIVKISVYKQLLTNLLTQPHLLNKFSGLLLELLAQIKNDNYIDLKEIHENFKREIEIKFQEEKSGSRNPNFYKFISENLDISFENLSKWQSEVSLIEEETEKFSKTLFFSKTPEEFSQAMAHIKGKTNNLPEAHNIIYDKLVLLIKTSPIKIGIIYWQNLYSHISRYWPDKAAKLNEEIKDLYLRSITRIFNSFKGDTNLIKNFLTHLNNAFGSDFVTKEILPNLVDHLLKNHDSVKIFDRENTSNAKLILNDCLDDTKRKIAFDLFDEKIAEIKIKYVTSNIIKPLEEATKKDFVDRHQLKTFTSLPSLFLKLLNIKRDLKIAKTKAGDNTLTAVEKALDATKQLLEKNLNTDQKQYVENLTAIAEYEGKHKRRIQLPKALGGKYSIRKVQIEAIKNLYIQTLHGETNPQVLIEKLQEIQATIEHERLKKTSRLLKILGKQINHLISARQGDHLTLLNTSSNSDNSRETIRWENIETYDTEKYLSAVFSNTNRALLTPAEAYPGNLAEHLEHIKSHVKNLLDANNPEDIAKLQKHVSAFEKELRIHDIATNENVYGNAVLKAIKPLLENASSTASTINSEHNIDANAKLTAIRSR